jgi:iron complex transport system ATP-binding protein
MRESDWSSDVCSSDLLTFDGRDYQKISKYDLLKMVSYLPQEASSHAALTVFETVLLGRLYRLKWVVAEEDYVKVDETLEKLGIEGLATRSLNELSGGQRQMVWIAQAIVKDPDVLLLDEPTNSLDLRHQLELFDLIQDITQENQMTTIIALHDLNLAARYAGKVILMNKGRVEAAGSPVSVITKKMIQSVYEVNSRVTIDPEGIPQVLPINSSKNIQKGEEKQWH